MIVVHFKTLLTPLRANILLFGLLAAATHAAVPVAWTNSPGMPPYPIKPVPHGVPVDFRVTLRGYSSPPAAPGADVRLWFQTNGMGSAWWSAPATLEGDVITATFGAEQDTGADRVALFFGAPSNVFASAILRLTHSPGFAPNVRPPPVARLDFSALEVLNAPYYTQAETDARIDETTNLVHAAAAAATNHTAESISASNPAFSAAVRAVPVSGADASDIAEVAEYGSYGTVGAALLALIAGLAALKRRMGAAETALSGKADAGAIAAKLDKLPTPCPSNFFPVTQTDGTLQRSSYTPASFAQSWHEHYSSSIMHYNAATGGYDSLDQMLDDLVARVEALEAYGGGGGDVGVTLGTVHHNGMSPTAYPGTVGGGDYSSWLSSDDCMTCLMVRADRVLDPAYGDFSMGGDLKSDFYGVVAGVEYEDPYNCTTARFVLPLYDGATCYGNASTLSDKSDFDYWRAGSPSSGVRGRLVQEADGTWWLCCTPRIQCFCESPMQTTYGDDDPYAIATAIKSTYSSSCFDFDAQMRAFLQYASCGCDEGAVVADGYTTVAISEYPAI